MKIAYLGKIQLSDVDLSYLHEAQKLADITYVLELNPRFMRGPAFNLNRLHPKSGLFKAADIYPEFHSLSGFIDLDRFYVLNTTGKLWILKSFWTYLILLRFLVRQKFTAIHLVWSPNIYEFSLYWLRKRMLLTVHDPFPHTAHNSLVVRMRRWIAFRLIPRLIILNKAQRQEFLDYYRINSRRVIDSRLSCYTYLKTVVPDVSSNAQRGSQILFFGRISPYKGIDYLLSAMKKVHEQCPDCHLTVAGGGSFHFDISPYEILDYIDIRNRFIPDSELVQLIEDSAFIVCPYTDATQSGVVMSAFAFNKPVIATNTGGLPEMVKHEHYGLIVERKDVDQLANAIIRLWKDKNLLNKFSKEIEDDYNSSELSWKEIAKGLCQEYSR